MPDSRLCELDYANGQMDLWAVKQINLARERERSLNATSASFCRELRRAHLHHIWARVPI